MHKVKVQEMSEMGKTILTRFEAVEYVWEHSQLIRDWYRNEHNFDLDNLTRSECGSEDLIRYIISDGVNDGIITENEDGEYFTV